MKENKITVFILFTTILTISIISLFSENNRIEKLEEMLSESQYYEVVEKTEELLSKRSLTIEERKKLYILKAISEYSLNQELNAKITFLELLSLDESVIIESNYLPDNITIFFNELKEQYLFKPE